METQELKNLIKESVREVLREERLLLCNMLMPYVSDQEIGKPKDYENQELTDMTNWLKNDP